MTGKKTRVTENGVLKCYLLCGFVRLLRTVCVFGMCPRRKIAVTNGKELNRAVDKKTC
jgi:hypothetical protein